MKKSEKETTKSTVKKTAVKKITTKAAPKTASKPKVEKEKSTIQAVVQPKAVEAEVKAVKAAPAKSKKTDKFSNPPVSKGTGRRKSSIARVWMRKGKGIITINGKDYKDYFDTETSRMIAYTPYRVCKDAASFDMEVNLAGGGKSAQADAVKLGISRALLGFNEALKPVLRENGLLTVDSRVKERKKYGQKAARRKFQFVKR